MRKHTDIVRKSFISYITDVDISASRRQTDCHELRVSLLCSGSWKPPQLRKLQNAPKRVKVNCPVLKLKRQGTALGVATELERAEERSNQDVG